MLWLVPMAYIGWVAYSYGYSQGKEAGIVQESQRRPAEEGLAALKTRIIMEESILATMQKTKSREIEEQSVLVQRLKRQLQTSP